MKVSDILHSLFNNKLKHVHRQLARCNPLFHFLNVLVPIGFVLVGQKIIILISIAPWCPKMLSAVKLYFRMGILLPTAL